MARDPEAFGEVPAARRCGSYLLGHDTHHIQARRSQQYGPGVPRVVASVDNDGTITFTDGTTRWNHHPVRLRIVIDQHGPEARLDPCGVLRISNGHGAYCFSVTDTANTCSC
jgi:hypothetical protein